jgi:predicted ester cyclase
MAIEERKAILRRFYEKGLSEGDPAAYDEALDENVVYHSPNRPDMTGFTPFKETIAESRATFAGYHFDVQQILVEGDMSMTRYIVSGVHTAQTQKFPFTPLVSMQCGMLHRALGRR